MIEPIDLHAYVDAELGDEMSATVEHDASLSPELQRELDAIRQLKTLLRDRSEAIQGESAWKLCVKRLDEVDKSRKVDLIVSRFAPAFCGALFVCILAGGFMARRHQSLSSSTPELSKMISVGGARHQSDEYLHTLIEQSKLSTPDHLQFRTCRNVVINGVAARSFGVRDADGDLTILAIPQLMDFDGSTSMSAHPEIKLGHIDDVNQNFVVRTLGDRTVVLIGDRSTDELVALLPQLIGR